MALLLSRGSRGQREASPKPPATHRPLASRLFTVLAPRAPSSISVVLSWLLILGKREGQQEGHGETDGLSYAHITDPWVGLGWRKGLTLHSAKE